MRNVSLAEIEEWGEEIAAKAHRLGLDCYPQEFEICDHHQMLAFMAYSGMPSRYPHWSFGKAYERLKTIYDHGVMGLPYEMVINANPCLAYLMRDNSLLLQILTMAHVFGHNDFFKNNFRFQWTKPELTLAAFKLHADRIRAYVEDPGIGAERVERALDAAHALAFQCARHPAHRRLSPAERMDRFEARQASLREERDVEFDENEYEKARRRTPLEPDEEILPFIRENNLHLEEWEKDILGIVDEETRYFLPQIDTKIMNEGWASYWHKRILESLDLNEELRLEAMVRHSQVLAPRKGTLNPYHLGYAVWRSIRVWYDGSLDRGDLRPDERELWEKMARDFEERDAVPPGTGERAGEEVMFEVRQGHSDASFIRRFLSPVLMRDLDLFEYEPRNRGGERFWVVTRVTDRGNWRELRDTLIRSVGMNAFPVIRVADANHRGRSTLLLHHDHDGRDLDLESAEKTLKDVQRLWGNAVALTTTVNDEPAELEVSRSGTIR